MAEQDIAESAKVVRKVEVAVVQAGISMPSRENDGLSALKRAELETPVIVWEAHRDIDPPNVCRLPILVFPPERQGMVEHPRHRHVCSIPVPSSRDAGCRHGARISLPTRGGDASQAIESKWGLRSLTMADEGFAATRRPSWYTATLRDRIPLMPRMRSGRVEAASPSSPAVGSDDRSRAHQTGFSVQRVHGSKSPGRRIQDLSPLAAWQ